MRENEFEKRVQQKMDDFHLHPSQDVWTEVERRIRKEKKRRILAWWPLFFLFGGGGIAAGILLTNKKEKNETIAANNKTEVSIQTSSEKTAVPGPVNNSTSINKLDTTTTNTATIVKENKDEIKIIADNTVTIFKPIKQIKEKKITPIAVKEKNQNNSNEESNEEIVTKDKQNKNQEAEPNVTTITTPKPTIPANDPGKNNDIPVVAKQEVDESVKLQQQVLPPTDSVANKQIRKLTDKKMKNWDWGISFSAGRSSIGNGFSLSNQHLFFDAAALQSNTPGNNFSNTASSVRPSFSWSAGLYIKKEISKKLDFNAGLGYSYLSTRINVGNRVDSTRRISNFYTPDLTVTNFYRPGGNSSHTNGFHFISLSADLSWRIINGKKINIYWENGLSFNRMLGSSMLHYDRNLQGYYKDNSLLGKNQLAFTTGFSIPVSKRLQVNPFVSYNLTPVLKNSDTLHFTNYGIRIRFLMNKK